MPAPLTTRVLEDIGRAIVSGALAEGEVLRMEDLARTHQVSRTVAREALRVLDSMDLVMVRQRVGVVVRPSSEWNVFSPLVVRWRLESHGREHQLRSLTALRAGVEPLAAAAMAHSPDRGTVTRLLEAAEDMARRARDGDLDAFLERDIEFHSTILANCGNEMFAALQAPITEVLRARHVLALMPDHPRDIPVQLHRLVALGIRDGDARTAQAAMSQIVEEVRTVVAETTPRSPTEVAH